ncbi:competence protein ComK [Mesobacillus foraminis]|uniref:competence protein ComK n=1 Tax=Mesobacillus foraminis TaxID=279826 RepID=UPI000EF4626F|nr:competence protein ComK [Mesobacillus foraminis]
MFIEKQYMINRHFMFMRGHYDRNGKQCTEINEASRLFIVDRAPLEVLSDSIRCIGFNLRGAMETSRSLLGDVHMCPIMVNPIHKIVLFPTRSPKHDETIWLNPAQIKRTTSINRKTFIEFYNGCTLIIPTRLCSFNHKLKIAEQFKDMMIETAENPFSSFQDKHKRKRVKVTNLNLKKN